MEKAANLRYEVMNKNEACVTQGYFYPDDTEGFGKFGNWRI